MCVSTPLLSCLLLQLQILGVQVPEKWDVHSISVDDRLSFLWPADAIASYHPEVEEAGRLKAQQISARPRIEAYVESLSLSLSLSLSFICLCLCLALCLTHKLLYLLMSLHQP